MAARSPHIRMRDVSRVYDALELGIIIADGNGTIIWGNRYYSSLAQFDIREYFGQNVRKISQREDVILPTERYMIDTVLETRQQQTQIVRYPTQDYVLTTATPILNKAGEIDYIIYSVSNYSDLMRLQEKASQSTMRAMALESHLRNMQVDSSIGKDIIIANKAMYNIYGKALRLAPTSASVMLTGESGTGKDVLARFIHQSSLRKHENFIHVNMATIPKPLFESELFGYTPGSFTGAARQGKEGLIQLADKGTIFLDEIGELPLDIQAKLLQVIQNKEVRAIGAVEPVPVDFRIICATNRNLKQMVDDHEFRLDLYYRLNAVELTLPPLRERPEDIPLLSTFFLNRYNEQNHTNKILSADALRLMQKYSWPGNVRELQHLIESMVVLCQSDTITADQLPDELKDTTALSSGDALDGKEMTLKECVEQFEIQLIQKALNNTTSAAKAAKTLGIDASTLCKKRKRYGI